MNNFLYAGKQITSTTDKLQRITVDYLYNSLRNPKSDVEMLVRNLRIARDMDAKRYAQMKRTLPYFVCGAFNPPYRKIENFAYTEFFILDIDKVSSKGFLLTELQKKLSADSRVMLSFASPGYDGLKLLFKLSERCYDAGIYKLFYQVFARKFSEQYDIGQLIDSCTCDVSRACFISIDQHATYNPNAEPVAMSQFLDMDNPSALFDLKREEEKETHGVDMQKRHDDAYADKDPDKSTINQIKAVLQIGRQQKAKIPPYVPEQLNDIMEELKKHIETTGIVVREIINISYGKKIRVQLGRKMAEVNLFFGKRGYSVVKSPRSGTDSELNELIYQIIQGYIYS